MRCLDNYFKSKELHIDEKLINTYVKYYDHVLISNGFSIVLTQKLSSDFKENEYYKSTIINFFETFIDKNTMEFIKTIEYDDIKNNLDDDKCYKINDDFGINYMQLKKIIDIIGCKKINIINVKCQDCIIEVLGKGMQVGYLLPTRIY